MQAPAQAEMKSALSSWRAIACLLVFYYHAGFNLQLGEVVIWGFIGVPMFFVLSGYLLFKPMCSCIQKGQPFVVKNYFIRRAFRIYPAYFCALIFYTVARYVQHLHLVTPWSFLVHVLMIFNISPQEFIAINIAFWTLALEAQFYILLPGLFLFAKNSDKRIALYWSLLFIAVGLISRFLEMHLTAEFPNPQGVRFRFITSYLDLFGEGMFLAWLDVQLKKSWILKHNRFYFLFMLGCLVTIAANMVFSHSGNIALYEGNSDIILWIFPTLLSFGIAMILFTLIRGESLVCIFLSNPLLVFIGEISYSLYLYHIGVQLAMARIYSPHFSNYMFQCFFTGSVYLPPTLLVSWLSYRFVELTGIRTAKSLNSSS